MKTKYLLICIVSMLVLFLTFWTGKYSAYSYMWSQSICYFALTLLLLRKYDIGGKVVPICFSIAIGRLLPDIPVRIMAFSESAESMAITFVALVGIALGALCYHEKRTSVFVLSIIIMVLLNTIGWREWLQFIDRTL